ncbi:MAG: hypothetical protein AVDCRST_MAG48-3179 [uncultured Friedmanniella sp.]|uniref:Uncharacterized protein n=1 Tax=uncultured Friedmanniella sp. TaxID=335381 RepID=A0A6J4LGI9_9ACTN|nr:MAG: hypothetical protein AVDCRST_MAG48-3179 [uncultured Friedmanniella sp.]
MWPRGPSSPRSSRSQGRVSVPGPAPEPEADDAPARRCQGRVIHAAVAVSSGPVRTTVEVAASAPVRGATRTVRLSPSASPEDVEGDHRPGGRLPGQRLRLRVRDGAGTVLLQHPLPVGDGPWQPLGSLSFEPAPGEDWTEVRVPLTPAPAVVDLRAEVPAGLQLLDLGGTT